jgi:hypothetical protein
MSIKLLINFLIFFTIYSHEFTSLGNTTYRVNSIGKVVYSLVPMFTEGFIGPLRSLYLMAIHGQIFSFLKLVFEFATNFWSPYSVIIFVYLLNKNY